MNKKICMTLLVSVFIMLTGLSFVYAETGVEINETNFPDDVFRDYIEEKVDTNNDGYLSDTECSRVTRISLYGNRISSPLTSLKGVEYFTNLNRLECSYNELTSLDISKNTLLTYLDCDSCNLQSLNVSKNTSLEILSCQNNNIKSLNTSKNTSLQALYASHNPNLNTLDVTKNTALVTLSCADTNLSSLDVTKNTSLVNLTCGENSLSKLDISKNTLLEYLHCGSNNLKSLDVTKNTALENLACNNNSLTTLDVSKNPALSSLSCSYNALTTLDLSKNLNLDTLYCSNNQLAYLDLEANTKLYDVIMYNQSYATTLPNNGILDLTTLTGSIDANKISNLRYGTLKGSKITVDYDTIWVRYTYKCSDAYPEESFEITFDKARIDFRDLDETADKALKLDANLYTEESYKGLESVMDQYYALNRDTCTQSSVDNLTYTIQDAIDALVYKPADYSKVEEAISRADALNPIYYVDFTPVTKAIDEVVYGKNISEQAVVDKYATNINKAINALELIDKTTLKRTTSLSWSNSSVKIKYSTVKGTDGYEIYGSKCDDTMKKITSTSGTSYIAKNANSKSYYKYKVRAYKLVDGEKIYVSDSYVLHIAGPKAKYTNAKSIKLNYKAITLKVKKSKTLKATIKKQSSKKELLWKGHCKKVRYFSTNSKIAKVSSKGKITALKKGTCRIYALASNGTITSVKITVK